MRVFKAPLLNQNKGNYLLPYSESHTAPHGELYIAYRKFINKY